MRVEIASLRGTNQQSGLEVERHYAVHRGPDAEGTVLVFDDNTDSFRQLTAAEYEEVPDPLEPHDLLRIDRAPDGYRAVCLCVWRPCFPDADPDEAVRTYRLHLSKMDIDRHHLTTPVHPRLQQWIDDLRERRRREPER
jgi:hypothetical protein